VSIVLDSSAMLALVRGEDGTQGKPPGMHEVQGLFDQLEEGDFGIFAHSVNLAEVFYDVLGTDGRTEAEATIADLKEAGVIERTDMDGAFWREVAELIAFRRVMPRDPARPDWVPRLALGDAFGAALANRLNAEFVTADRTELEPMHDENKVVARFIR